MCLNLACFTWSNSYEPLKSPISNVDSMAVAPYDRYFLKVYDLNFRMNFFVALFGKGVSSIQNIASRRSPIED